MLRLTSTLFVYGVLAWAMPGTADAAENGRPLSLEDLGREVRLESPVFSPDGKAIALITRRIDYVDNRHVGSLLLIDVDDRTVRELVAHRPDVKNPRFSPDGSTLAWLDKAEDGEFQIYTWKLKPEAPLPGRMTHFPEGVSDYRFSPSGERFAILTPDAEPEAHNEAAHNKAFEVGNNSYLTKEAPLPSHLWLAPSVRPGDTERLTAGAASVTAFEWLPDGQRIVYVGQPRPHSGEFMNSFLRMIDAETGDDRVLVAGPMSFRGGPAVSPGGRLIVHGHYRGKQPSFHPRGLAAVSTDGGERRDLTAALDRDLRDESWLPDGSGVLAYSADGTRTSLWLQPLDAGARRIDTGPITAFGDLVVSGHGAVAFIGSESGAPFELYHMRTLDTTPRRLTNLNQWLHNLALARVDAIEWDGPDEFREDGVLTYPPDFDAESKYPLVLRIHGGPMSASLVGWDRLNQLMAARGWVVFSPNYRGSNNRGEAYQAAVINDAGDGPGRDVMAGIAAVKALGFVDEHRTAVSGWSYGGFMTAWLTAHYDGWCCAMAGAAVTDWYDWYSMADMNVWAGYGLGGSPWLNDNAANYWRQSPMAYAHSIRTPTLILSNTGDERVTVTQSYKLYHALKDNDVEVEFIAYPISGHWPGDPVHEKDLYRRWIEWLADHFEAMMSDTAGTASKD